MKLAFDRERMCLITEDGHMIEGVTNIQINVEMNRTRVVIELDDISMVAGQPPPERVAETVKGLQHLEWRLTRRGERT